MTAPEHSPLPWFIGAQNDRLFIINKPPRPSTDNIVDIPECTIIAKIYIEADAHLIVTAVNTHAGLLAAAKDVIAHANSGHATLPYGTCFPRLEAAIAAAEESAS